MSFVSLYISGFRLQSPDGLFPLVVRCPRTVSCERRSRTGEKRKRKRQRRGNERATLAKLRLKSSVCPESVESCSFSRGALFPHRTRHTRISYVYTTMQKGNPGGNHFSSGLTRPCELWWVCLRSELGCSRSAILVRTCSGATTGALRKWAKMENGRFGIDGASAYTSSASGKKMAKLSQKLGRGSF